MIIRGVFILQGSRSQQGARFRIIKDTSLPQENLVIDTVDIHLEESDIPAQKDRPQLFAARDSLDEGLEEREKPLLANAGRGFSFCPRS